MRTLFKRYPELVETLPMLPLANLPTPVDKLHTFSTDVGGDVWLKHDEHSGALYGGNKVRKLEFLLADALEQNYTDVLTYGAVGSNHALATAIYAREYQLRCHVVLTPQPASPKVANTLLYHLDIGTDLLPVANYPSAAETAARLRATLTAAGRTLYEIPFGGSSPLGTIGFVNAALELAEQITAGEMPEPERIYLACGTSGSVSGLSLGLRLAGISTRVIATQVTPASISGPAAHERLFNETNALLHTLASSVPLLANPRCNVEHRDEQFGTGYAEPTVAAKLAVERMQQTEAISLETTYTGKALAALINDIESGISGPVMFWNTYNAQPYQCAAAARAQELPALLQQYL
jgi:1-aminocyclopropane-1-carboxylate deaminase/D-cysteine desulfhydrase-like pyridoxal-dependent ACC family enzyme